MEWKMIVLTSNASKQTINTNNVLYPYRHIYTKSLAYEETSATK